MAVAVEKSQDEPENQPSPPLHPGTVHDALLSRLANASDREEHQPRGRTEEEHQYE